ncbi:hypothetical protein QUF80_01125 [Desulfococcaceae bacterium HSG8]|nr:hypothetical protein [Desulfococcaceae bacterium HSG8]
MKKVFYSVFLALFVISGAASADNSVFYGTFDVTLSSTVCDDKNITIMIGKESSPECGGCLQMIIPESGYAHEFTYEDNEGTTHKVSINIDGKEISYHDESSPTVFDDILLNFSEDNKSFDIEWGAVSVTSGICANIGEGVRRGDNGGDTGWVSLGGSVMNEEGTSLCAMVLANGQYMFSCEGGGEYDLEVPLDDKGEITLFAFCDGLAPFRQVMTEGEAGTDIDINMESASPDSKEMTITSETGTAVVNPGWVKISGEVSDENGTPLCAMVLANGEHMFSCAGDGKYELEVPLDGNGEITLFGFCDGLQPYKEILAP